MMIQRTSTKNIQLGNQGILVSGGGGAAAPAWTPASLPSYYADFNGVSLAGLADADPITSWTDTAAAIAVAQGTGGNQPTKRSITNGGANFVAARFDGSNDFLVTAGVVTHNIGSGDWSVIAVVKENIDQLGTIFTNGDYSASVYPRHTGGGQVSLYDGGYKLSGTAMSFGNWHWLVFQRNSGNYEFFIDGVQTATSPAISLVSWANAKWALGTEGGASASVISPLGGDLARVIVCKAKLAAGDITDMDTYCVTAYGIS